ncbi:MAG: DUF3102 domain-containing protein [Thermoguttaceae bacterium]|jgi:hypothetical protein
MDSSAIAEKRQTELATLASEINAHHQAAEAALNRGLEEAHKCGELLLEAKAACPHGTWQKWLADNFRGSMRTAQCYMRIANHWAEIEAKSADSALLSIDGAVKLLAAPKPMAIDAADPGFKIDKYFLDIGGSLRKIRDGRLYRETHRDFYAYCRDKWELEREEVDQFIQSANWLESAP